MVHSSITKHMMEDESGETDGFIGNSGAAAGGT